MQCARHIVARGCGAQSGHRRGYCVLGLHRVRRAQQRGRDAAEGFTPGELFSAHAKLSVEKRWLDANQIHQWAVSFNRFDTEKAKWVPTQAKRVSEDETQVFFSVVVTGFSLWAIAGETEVPPVRANVDNLEIVPAEPREGQTVTVSAQITKIGRAHV